ncbi:MAG TPA: Stp1/IreP family PP2C-type Ser/Thr phosphatase [Thermoleophilia bacterium]|nr:Stp1/IreP family PP2C-type Ser/Thr phosphatase [Thermoleophilia bacterium]
MPLVARHAAVTDIGLHRATNEDSYVDDPPLFAVADGMGGANAGEVASRLAIETLVSELAAGATLTEAAAVANTRVYEQAGADRSHSGMGTTLTAARRSGDGLEVAHVGDSRLYRLRDGVLEQLTDDHSLVGEMVREGHLTREAAQNHPQRSILSRALGTEPVVEIDDFTAEARAGDALLLCSDGLYSMVSEDGMKAVLEAIDDPLRAARQLVREAKNEGGHDNITAIVVRFDEAEEGAAADDAGAAGVAAAAPSSEASGSEQVTAPLPPLPPEAEAGAAAAGAAPAAAAAEEPTRTEAGDDDLQGAERPVDRAASAEDEESPAPRRSRRRLVLVLVLIVLVVGALAVGAVVSGVYYVGVDNGMVSVYRGLPLEVGGLRLNDLYLRTTTPIDVVEPGLRQRIEDHELHRKSAALELARRAQGLP